MVKFPSINLISTLLYSFIIGKRSELELCAETLKTGNNDPLIKKRQSNLIQQIKKLASINNKVFIILILSMIVCIISWASIRFIPSYYHFGFLFLVGVFSLLIIAITINMLRKLYIEIVTTDILFCRYLTKGTI